MVRLFRNIAKPRSERHRFTWICVIAILFPLGGPAETLSCRFGVISHICVDGPEVSSLLNLDRFLTEFQNQANDKIRARSLPSNLSPDRRHALEIMWQDATEQAFRYASGSALKPDDFEMFLEHDRFVADPIFNLNFRWDGQHYTYDEGSGVNAVVINDWAAKLQHKNFGMRIVANSLMALTAKNPAATIPMQEVIEMPLLGVILSLILPGRNDIIERFQALPGLDLVLFLWVDLEQKFRTLRSIQPPRLHLFAEQDDDITSPEVTQTGVLMLSDEVVARFDDVELELIMLHEATHLSRPNLISMLGLADGVIRQNFPQLVGYPVAHIAANLSGEELARSGLSCPIVFSADDEIFVDYFVLSMLRGRPSAQRAYGALLHKFADEFDRGGLGQMSFRLKALPASLGRISQKTHPQFSQSAQNNAFFLMIRSLFRQAMEEGQGFTMIDAFVAMQEDPHLRFEGALLETLLQYYSSTSDSALGARKGVDCGLIERVMALR